MLGPCIWTAFSRPIRGSPQDEVGGSRICDRRWRTIRCPRITISGDLLEARTFARQPCGADRSSRRGVGMALELSRRGGCGVGRVHHEGRAQRRRLLRDHRNQRRGERRRHHGPAAGRERQSPATTATRSTISSGPTLRSSPCTASATRSPTGPTPIPSTAPISSTPGYYAFFSDPANRRTSEPLVEFTATIVR